MGKNTIVKVHKVTQQHGSIIVVIPYVIRAALLLDSGDYIVFELDRDTYKVEVSKFELKGADDVGLRALSTHECVKDIMTILTKPAEPLHELDNSTHTWNKRNKEYLEKLKNGNLQELSEMYRDLHYIAAQKELSFGERGLLNQIENLLVEEIATVEETGRERMLEQVRMLCINQAQKAMVQKVI